MSLWRYFKGSYLDITNLEFLEFTSDCYGQSICDYLIYFVRNIKQALRLCEEVLENIFRRLVVEMPFC